MPDRGVKTLYGNGICSTLHNVKPNQPKVDMSSFAILAEQMSRRIPLSKASLAITAVALLIGGCSGDQIVDSVRPNVLDQKAKGNSKISALMRVAATTASAGDLATAVGLYRRAHELDPLLIDPLVALGKTLGALGDQHGAADAFRKAIALSKASPSSRAVPEAAHGLGNALVAMDQPRAAITQYEYAMMQRDDPRTFNGIGVAYDMLGRHGAAQAYYRTGLDVDPDNVELKNNLGLSLAITGKFNQAIALLKGVAFRKGATSRSRLNLALVYGLAGRMTEAANIARQDLDESSVQNNLTYYETLRNLKDTKALFQAIGANTDGYYTDPDRPASMREKREVIHRQG